MVEDELVHPASVLAFALLLAPLGFLLLEAVLLAGQAVRLVALLFQATGGCDCDRVRVFLGVVGVIVVADGLEMAEHELDLVTGVALISFD